MINILLVCSAGMSTSMLVKKMQEAADKKNIEANVWAVGDAESQEESKKADIILLGPQVRYLEAKMKERVDNKKPVSVIDMLVYGTMNGEKALDNALKDYEKFNK
ncbi:PTS sugar transporter subunit IIB [Senegalia massiliensis]|uniref:PTS sugar transporter subunit IIB n=1 Tax=Senegalia massiliensis TaxID=1720316 RepID=A0A845R134_9CLOT|nr:PTS sugar transporter subunit IIB [Senegalia massiliensis]NBI07208.1 PTS sugar transporter subunit IIB [Senegalia massiliensis]